MELKGALTALATPMNGDGSVDFGALDALVDWQLEQGIYGLVPCGTTGESATMTADERATVITAVVKKVAGRVPVIAGAGANDTAVACEHQRRALDTGAAAALVVTPYYNKPTQEGLVLHYRALREAADMPLILYNVPGRTGCDLLPDTVCRLAEDSGIVGIKEASADLDRVAMLDAGTPDGFVLLSGDDPTALPFVLLGGDGVISVSSNCAPRDMADMIAAARKADVATARKFHRKLSPLFKALFWESNPIPVKAALTMQKRMHEHYRLPLCKMSDALRPQLRLVLETGGWLP